MKQYKLTGGLLRRFSPRNDHWACDLNRGPPEVTLTFRPPAQAKKVAL